MKESRILNLGIPIHQRLATSLASWFPKVVPTLGDYKFVEFLVGVREMQEVFRIEMTRNLLKRSIVSSKE